MQKPNPNEDLAKIVRAGASKPVRKSIIMLVVIALLGSGVWYFFNRNDNENSEPKFITEPVKRGRISLIVTAAGNLAPTNQVIIGSELSGTVKELYIDTNDTVKKDQPLAKLDTSKLEQQTERSRAARLAAQARVSQAEATLAESKAALARQEELLKLSEGKTPSKATMETSRATVARAEADLQSAKASVTGAEADVRAFESDLKKAIICSPVDGVVLSRSIEVGQTVAASFTAPTLFTIAEDLKKMELLVSVSEADIGRVQVGQTATFSVDAWPTRSYTATVEKVAFGSANNNTNSNGGSNNNGNNSAAATGIVIYSTELNVPNDDLSLRPGMTASVDIAIEDKKDIMVVPNTALRFDPEVAAAIGKPTESKRTIVETLMPSRGRFRSPSAPKSGTRTEEPHVWILKNGKPEMVIVKTGITDGLRTEIIGDSLSEEAPIIVSIKPIEKAE
ncbi:MAG: efflux RND transporter periplasmic adaptor subunit [Verrucomicrobiota bacterium]